jgi:hypothetical protein
MRSTLAKSLLIDFLLTSIYLSHGDNPRGVVAAWRVGNNNYSTGEQAQSDQPFPSPYDVATFVVIRKPAKSTRLSRAVTLK